MPGTVTFTLDGRWVTVDDDGCSLLEALRDRLGARTPKDGCSPQGQCGCCTVLVDGQPRVACVTPAKRVAGRSVVTVDGLDAEVRDRWAEALCATGGSQCGFCTPGIVLRLDALRGKGGAPARGAVDQALLAHLCRCTGWQTIREAFDLVVSAPSADISRPAALSGGRAALFGAGRDLDRAARRAAIEGGTHQRVAPDVALGRGGFADDTAPADALVAVLAADGSWVVGETLSDARARASKVQGRRTTVPTSWPIDLPSGDWDRTLQTTWVEPAYLEPDASWCEPGGAPVSPLGNGGAFGGKVASDVGEVARRLADEHGRPVRVLYAREDVVRRGPKRPPMAIGARADGTGVVRVARTPGIASAIATVAPGIVVEEVDLPGPPTSVDLRAAGWAEVAVVLASLCPEPSGEVRAPNGAVARAEVCDDLVRITVRCGDPLDEIVLRSYCIGAAHQALGWVRSEGIAVDAEGAPHDLTIRSFGILRATDLPLIEVVIEPDDAAPVNGSDAVFAAVAAAAWRHAGYPPRWPITAR